MLAALAHHAGRRDEPSRSRRGPGFLVLVNPGLRTNYPDASAEIQRLDRLWDERGAEDLLRSRAAAILCSKRGEARADLLLHFALSERSGAERNQPQNGLSL